jgi:hypothetical protein
MSKAAGAGVTTKSVMIIENDLNKEVTSKITSNFRHSLFLQIVRPDESSPSRSHSHQLQYELAKGSNNKSQMDPYNFVLTQNIT